MKKTTFLFLLAFLLLSISAEAQFKKALAPTHSTTYSSEAKYNVGLIGGGSMTYWLHINKNAYTKYNQPFNIGPVGGIVVERMLGGYNSVSLEGLFAMRNTQLNYNMLNIADALNVNKDYFKQFDVNYMEVDVQIPLTQYFGQRTGTIRPYVYAAPRLSLPLSGKMTWQKREIINYGTPNQSYGSSSIDTVIMSANNMRPWNVGVVFGAGVLFKINWNNYYFLVKADVSAHYAIFNSFSKKEINGDESLNVVGAGYIDPYLLGMRFNTDATARITFLLPLKKQLKGACMRWGEYD